MAAVPTITREDYTARVWPAELETFTLPGGQGTVTVLEDGRGWVKNAQGHAVGTLDAGTTAAIRPRPADAPRTAQPSFRTDILTIVREWWKGRGLTNTGR